MRHKKKPKQKRRPFVLDTQISHSLCDYDAFTDVHLQHYFARSSVQQSLLDCNMIDCQGRVMELDKHKSKLFIIDQEIKRAIQMRQAKLKEEQEIKWRVLKKHEIYQAQQAQLERVQRLKREAEIRRQLLGLSNCYSKNSHMKKSTAKLKHSRRKGKQQKQVSEAMTLVEKNNSSQQSSQQKGDEVENCFITAVNHQISIDQKHMKRSTSVQSITKKPSKSLMIVSRAKSSVREKKVFSPQATSKHGLSAAYNPKRTMEHAEREIQRALKMMV